MFKIKEYRARPYDLNGAWEVYQYNAEENDWDLVEEYKWHACAGVYPCLNT